jgi:hypothetical protein
MCLFSKGSDTGKLRKRRGKKREIVNFKNLCKQCKEIMYNRLKLSIIYAILRKTFHEKFSYFA